MPKQGMTYRDKNTEMFCGLAFMYPKLEGNIGTAMRAASCLDMVDFFATIGERYNRPRSDTVYSPYRHPTFTFADFETFEKCKPLQSELVVIEQHEKAIPLETFEHPKRAVYVFGAEDSGVPTKIVERIKHKVCLPSPLGISMNLSSCAAMVLWDRYLKMNKE